MTLPTRCDVCDVCDASTVASLLVTLATPDGRQLTRTFLLWTRLFHDDELVAVAAVVVVAVVVAVAAAVVVVAAAPAVVVVAAAVVVVAAAAAPAVATAASLYFRTIGRWVQSDSDSSLYNSLMKPFYCHFIRQFFLVTCDNAFDFFAVVH